jgi:hypothetical protein
MTGRGNGSARRAARFAWPCVLAAFIVSGWTSDALAQTSDGSAQTPDGSAQTSGRASRSPLRRTGLFLIGAAAGLGIHEGGHVTFGAALGAGPSVKRISYGPIPFFAINHRPVTRRREFVISSAGLWTQQASAEWVLTRHRRLRDEDAPALKGLLAFHLVVSTMYGVAGFGRIGPPERDTLGIAASLGRRGVSEPAVGALVLAPAVLDGYRYLRPDSAWARWMSRGLKIGGLALTLAAGR